MRDDTIKMALKTGKLSYEARVIRKDGALRWIQVQGKVFYNDKREPMRLVGTLKDVTEHREMIGALSESEQRFRSVADTAPVMIWMSGTDKLCYYFNSAWLSFTGRVLDEEKGNGWADNVHPEDLAMLLNVYDTSFDAHREFYIEYRLRRQDGEYRWISSKGVPVSLTTMYSWGISGYVSIYTISAWPTRNWRRKCLFARQSSSGPTRRWKTRTGSWSAVTRSLHRSAMWQATTCRSLCARYRRLHSV